MADENCPPPTFLAAHQWSLVVKRLKLSPTEAAVAACIVNGKTELETAELLSISVHTVHSHVRRIYAKLGVHDRLALVRCFLEAATSAGGPPGAEAAG